MGGPIPTLIQSLGGKIKTKKNDMDMFSAGEKKHHSNCKRRKQRRSLKTQ
jgi:hypothetical protein